MENNSANSGHALYIAHLIHKVREKETLSETEWDDLQGWRRASPENERIFQQLQDRKHLEAEVRALLEMDCSADAEAIYEKLGLAAEGEVPMMTGYRSGLPAARNRMLLAARNRMLPAAAVLLIVCAGTYLWLRQTPVKLTIPNSAVAVKPDVEPGRQGAILTLADGRTVVLDSLGNGLVATQSGSKVLLRDGQLAYEKDNSSGETVYNTMTTPKGRQFRLELPDGTSVWLNAASSLRYPTVFKDGERRVEVTGEAYFEVAQQAGKPFVVDIEHRTTVEVLGTHFNINAYRDEASINTTLLQGAVKVVVAGESAVLKPGQQAQMRALVVDRGAGSGGAASAGSGSAGSGGADPGGAGSGSASAGIKIVRDADVEKIMAWKNGVFDFQDASLEDVMRQLRRWYDIDVVYEKGIPKIEFIGKMGRDLSLAAVLKGLEMSKVHFRLEDGRRLIVLP